MTTKRLRLSGRLQMVLDSLRFRIGGHRPLDDVPRADEDGTIYAMGIIWVDRYVLHAVSQNCNLAWVSSGKFEPKMTVRVENLGKIRGYEFD